MLNVWHISNSCLFSVSQLFFSFFAIKTSSFTGLSFPRHRSSHKQQGISRFLSSSMLRSWKPLWSLVSLLFPSHWMSFRAYLTTNGLLHKYKKCKSHSIPVLQKNSVWRKSGSQTVHGNIGIFERLASTTHWSKLYMTAKLLGLYILLSSSINLSILSLYFAGVNSLFPFWQWTESQLDFLWGNLPGDFADPQKMGLLFAGTWQYQTSGIYSCKPQGTAVPVL